MLFRAVVCWGVVLSCVAAVQDAAAAPALGLKASSVSLQSAGPLAFGPYGVLFVGDPKAATIYALDTRDAQGTPGSAKLDISQFQELLADLLQASKIEVADLAVNPLSGNIYLSVSADDAVAIVKVDSSGAASRLPLESVRHSKSVLPNPPADEVVGQGRRRRNLRMQSITDLAFLEGQLIVAGLSNRDAPSTARALAFPFSSADEGVSLEFFHGAHGRVENYPAIQTFVAMNIEGTPNLLAGFTCTPLVKFPISKLTQSDAVTGTTVAELGNRNQPLDMIVYEQGGKNYLLMANSARGVMKISTRDIERNDGITQRVEGGGVAGQKYETIEDLKNVRQLDLLGTAHAVILTDDGGQMALRTIPLP